MRRLRRSTAAALSARNRTPAEGERDQRHDDQRVEDDRREDRRPRGLEVHDVDAVEGREHAHEHRRDDGEVLGHVVGDREGRQRAAGDEQLLADLHDLDQLRRVRVEVDHVPGFLGGLRAGVHGHADVGLRERGRVVGAVAGHRHEVAAGLLAPDQRHLVLGGGLGEEVVDAGLLGDGRRGERVVAGDHHRADAHAAQLVEPLPHALLDDVLELDHPEGLAPLGHDQRRAAAVGDLR